MSTDAESKRPLSPHLQIYRWPLSMAMSISHRITGVMLSVGTVVLAAWLIVAAAGPDVFARLNGHFGTWYGLLLLIGWSYALFYHLCNGVRHLIWDTGHMLAKETATTSGYITLAVSVVLTAAAWLLALA